MRIPVAIAALALAIGAAACNETAPSGPADNPTAATMSFKTGARYQYESYTTDAQTGEQSTKRTRTWTLVNPSATVAGRTGVAVYVDSVIGAGGVITVADSIYLQQQPGTNDVYRYASVAPELDVAGVGLLDLGRTWMHEARLNASVASWFVGQVADTIPNTFGIPAVSGFQLAVVDSAVGSTTEAITIGGQSYTATKTTHSLRFKVSAIVSIIGPVEVGSTSTTRTTWIVPSLGAIVREERQAKVIDATYQGQGFQIPVPGYTSVMTSVLATG